jgi:transposase
MIVIGADTHKQTHTVAAVDGATGRVVGDKTAAARTAGFDELLRWGRGLDAERVWAIEDCRHVSGGLERFLVARGERVVRVPPKLMAGARQGGRERGKSDPIDATAVARAAIREDVATLPTAHLDDRALAIRLLLDHHDALVVQRGDDQRRLRWNLHDLWPELDIPAGALDRTKWIDKIARRLARAEQTARVRVAREQLAAIRALTRRVRELERELAGLVADYAPQLLAERGCGTLTAAKLIGQIAGIERFATDAKLARTAGTAPIPASSGRRDRHRLDRGGDRQLNLALHRLAVNKGKWCPETAAYLARKQQEGKTRMSCQTRRARWRLRQRSASMRVLPSCCLRAR